MRWRRTIGWTFAVLGVLVFAGAVGGYLFFKSRSFQEYALRIIVDQTNDATGGPSRDSQPRFQLSTLTAHLYNITLHGSELPTNRHSCRSTNYSGSEDSVPADIARLR